MFNTPILFLIFNRPHTTERVFQRIREVKPKYLFVAADGPRLNISGELERVNLTRNIATAIDWDCELKTLFRSENLGCGLAPSSAITWFFNNVEQGIILEDDCLPDLSFFTYCEELLLKHKDNDQIMLISGFNGLNKFKCLKADYFYSKYAGIWGWATWRRAWATYNFNVPEWNDEYTKKQLLNSFSNEKVREEFAYHLDKAVDKEFVDFWDYQWWFYRVLHNGLGIIPTCNLIANIGFGNDATHTFNINHKLAHTKVFKVNSPLIHPTIISDNIIYSEMLLNTNQGKRNKIIRGFNKIKRLFSFLQI